MFISKCAFPIIFESYFFEEAGRVFFFFYSNAIFNQLAKYSHFSKGRICFCLRCYVQFIVLINLERKECAQTQNYEDILFLPIYIKSVSNQLLEIYTSHKVSLSIKFMMHDSSVLPLWKSYLAQIDIEEEGLFSYSRSFWSFHPEQRQRNREIVNKLHAAELERESRDRQLNPQIYQVKQQIMIEFWKHTKARYGQDVLLTRGSFLVSEKLNHY